MRHRDHTLHAILVVLCVGMSCAPRAKLPLLVLPAAVEVVPGALTVKVISAPVTSGTGKIRAWWFLSEGLEALGQQEILVGVKQRPGEADSEVPGDVFEYFKIVHDLALQGRVVGPGDVTIFDGFHANGLLGRRDFLGVIYMTPPKEASSLATSVLSAVIVTAREAKASYDYGSVRVLTALGSENGFFPTAFWSDRDRAELQVIDTTARESILANILVLGSASTEIVQIAHPTTLDGRRACVGAKLHFDDAVVEVRLSAGRQLPEAIRKLGETTPFAVTARPAADATASFVWVPGPKNPPTLLAAAGCDASRTNAAFAVFSPREHGATETLIVEDGFAFILSKDDWSALREAIAEEAPLRLKAGGRVLALVWTASSVDKPARMSAPATQGQPLVEDSLHVSEGTAPPQ